MITEPKKMDLKILNKNSESHNPLLSRPTLTTTLLTHNSSCYDTDIFLRALVCTECLKDIGYWNIKVGKRSFSSETDDSFWSLFNFLLPTVFHFRIQHYHTKKYACSVNGVAYWTSVHQKLLLSALNWVFATMFGSWNIKTIFCELF